MEHAKKQQIIDSIVFGDFLFNEFLIKSPNAELKSRASFTYTNSLTNAINCGMMKESDLIKHFIQTGVLDGDYFNKLDLIQDKIKMVSKGLINFIFDTKKLDKAKQLLRKLENEFTGLITKKNKLVRASAENFALTEQQRFIVSNCTFVDGNKLWPTQKKFDSFEDTKLINDIIYYLFCTSLFPRSTIRLIARTNPWRQVWVCCKDKNPFDRSPCDWSVNQTELCYWSKTYDLVFDAYERPSQQVIDDDDLLDSWFINQSVKIENRCKKEAIENLCNTKNNKPGINEQFVVTNQQDAKKIYDANDRHGKSQVIAQRKIMNKKGTVDDQNMPKSQEEIRRTAMTMRNEKIRRK